MSNQAAVRLDRESYGRPPRVGPAGDVTNRQSLSLRDSVVDLIPNLRGFARSLARNADDADDLVQETLTRAIHHIDQFRPGTNLKAWLFTILRNTHISHSKRKSRELRATAQGEAEDYGRAAPQPWAAATTDVHAAIDRLPSDFREVLILIGGAGLSYEECAEVCGCPVGTVKSRLSRARDQLQSLLEADSVDAIV
jgi:RNA polymerase sigma-70 factor (ECF subfamily)